MKEVIGVGVDVGHGLDGARERLSQGAVRVSREQLGSALPDIPGRAVPAAGLKSLGGAEAIQEHGGPGAGGDSVLVVLRSCGVAEGDVHASGR